MDLHCKIISLLSLQIALASCAGSTSTSLGPPDQFQSAPLPASAPRLEEPSAPVVPADFDSAEFRQNSGLNIIRAAEGYAAQRVFSPTGQPGGSGKTVGVIDSGIDPNHPEFENRVFGAFFSNAGIQESAQDFDGHGTHVAATAVGRRDGRGMHGVAYNADLSSIKLFSDVGRTGRGLVDGTLNLPSNAKAAILSMAGIRETVFVLDRFGRLVPTVDRFGRILFDSFGNPIPETIDTNTAFEADVINMSWRSILGDPNGELADAIFRAAQRGKIMTIATGNDSSGALGPNAVPALLVDTAGRGLALGVTALNRSGTGLASFANGCGALFHCLAAPGEDIVSALPNGRLGSLSGTSMAAPHVAGAAAVALAAFPGVAPSDIVLRILNTADDLGLLGRDALFGHGRLNMERLLTPQGSLLLSTGTKVSGGGIDLASFNVQAGRGVTLSNVAAGAQAVAFDSMGFPFEVNLAPHFNASTTSLELLDFFERSSTRSGTWTSGALITAFGSMEPQSERVGFGIREHGDSQKVESFGIAAAFENGLEMRAGSTNGGYLRDSTIHSSALSQSPLSSTSAEVPFVGSGNSLSVSHWLDDSFYIGTEFFVGDGQASSADVKSYKAFARYNNAGLELDGQFGLVNENGSVAGTTHTGLSQRFSSDSTFFSVGANIELNDSVSAGMRYSHAFSSGGGDQTLRISGHSSNSVSASVSVSDLLWGAGDQLHIIGLVPFAAINGTASLKYPISRNEEGKVFYSSTSGSLKPVEREMSLQLLYQLPTDDHYSIELFGFARINADNVEGSDDFGAGLRVSLDF